MKKVLILLLAAVLLLCSACQAERPVSSEPPVEIKDGAIDLTAAQFQKNYNGQLDSGVPRIETLEESEEAGKPVYICAIRRDVAVKLVCTADKKGIESILFTFDSSDPQNTDYDSHFSYLRAALWALNPAADGEAYLEAIFKTGSKTGDVNLYQVNGYSYALHALEDSLALEIEPSGEAQSAPDAASPAE